MGIWVNKVQEVGKGMKKKKHRTEKRRGEERSSQSVLAWGICCLMSLALDAIKHYVATPLPPTPGLVIQLTKLRQRCYNEG